MIAYAVSLEGLIFGIDTLTVKLLRVRGVVALWVQL